MAIANKLVSFAGKGLTKRLSKKFSKKLTAKQLAAARRNIKKAIAARARMAGKAALRSPKALATPFKAYGKSVTKRATKRKNKLLTRISKGKMSQEAELSSFNKRMLQLGRQRDIVRAESGVIRKQLEKTAAQAQKLSKYNPQTGGMMLKKDTAVNRFRLNKILNQNEKLTIKYNQNADILRMYHQSGIQFAGKRAQMENKVEDLAAQYAKISNQSFVFKAGVVSRDVAKTAIIGSGGYMGYQEYKNKRAKKKT